MAVKTKKTGTKKNLKATAAKAKSKAKPVDPDARRKHDYKQLMDTIVSLRDEGENSWADIAQETGATAGLCMLLYKAATTPKSERIFGTDKEMAKAIAVARDKENQSWGTITARCYPVTINQGRVQKLYETHTGETSRQGNLVVERRVAAKPKAEPKPAKVKAAKTLKTTTAANKKRRSSIQKNRKTANPSKG